MEDEKTEKTQDNLLRIFVLERYGEPTVACWTKEEAEELTEFIGTSDNCREVPIVQVARRSPTAKML